MKKIVLTLAAVAAFTGSAYAADMAPAPAYKALPPPVVAPSWTGFYVFGGAGGGVWDADSHTVTVPGGTVLTQNQRMGGDGWLGTAGAGFDWQFNRNWVAGVFADGMFGSLRGSVTNNFFNVTGTEKLRDTWAVGARLGYLVAPNVYSYVNAGYTETYWSGSTLSTAFLGIPVTTTPSFNREGWFIGGGVENNLDIFGISAPGFFMKTEYRAAYLNNITLPESFLGTTTLTGFGPTMNSPLVQTITTSLVYRFNWGGPVVAKY
jgi:outer membrane immunogenic protein